MADYRAKTFYKGNIAQEYDRERFSSLKGKLYDFFEKRSITRALRGLSTKWSVLDLPCGTGRITEHISKLGYIVYGTDISQDMLEIAKSRLPHIKFFKADIYTMPNHSNLHKRFGIITCMRFMGHLPYKRKIEALRTMKSMARLCLIVTFYKNKWYKKCPKYWYPIEDKELEHLLEICGLTIMWKYPICPGWSDGVTYVLR